MNQYLFSLSLINKMDSIEEEHLRKEYKEEEEHSREEHSIEE